MMPLRLCGGVMTAIAVLRNVVNHLIAQWNHLRAYS